LPVPLADYPGWCGRDASFGSMTFFLLRTYAAAHLANPFFLALFCRLNGAGSG
jgi:hypothetical protein